MNDKKPYLVQATSRPSQRPVKLLDSISSSVKIHDCKPFQETKAKQVLIKFDQERPDSQKHYDPCAIQGWTQSSKQNIKQLLCDKKEIRKHQKCKKRSHHNSYEPKYLQQTNTKATISYLKEMLAYLRTSSETTSNARSISTKNKSSLPSIQYNSIQSHSDNNSTVLVKIDQDREEKSSKELKERMKEEEKQNIFKERQNIFKQKLIIDQLVNGIHRLPVLGPSNRNPSLQRKNRMKQKFTLDKLLS